MSAGVDDRRAGGKALARVVYDQAILARRVAELGREIASAYPDGELVLIGLLKGSFVFVADLARAIDRPVQVDFVVVSSYGTGQVSSGQVAVRHRPALDLRGKHVLLIEDIIDSGRTLAVLAEEMGRAGAKSIAVCALLDKGLSPALPAPVRFVGFRAPSVFLVGYGLDHAEDFRHLPYIAELG